jgi:hypothetical protein
MKFLNWTPFLLLVLSFVAACGAADAPPEASPELVEVEQDRIVAWREITGDFGEDCVVDCAGRECGSDACGGSCGLCPSGFACGPEGTCVPAEPEPGSCAFGGCFITCQVTDDQCLASCVSKLDDAAQTHAWDLQECALDTCGYCNPPTDTFSPMAFICWAECLRETCIVPYTECLTGQSGCWSLGGCVKNCPQSESFCPMDCFSEATLDSQGAFLELTKCMFGLCPFGGKECQQASVKEGPCHIHLQSCLKQ